jgi:hypothetical protein
MLIYCTCKHSPAYRNTLDQSNPRAHPHLPQQKDRQHAPRARWRPAGHARAAPAATRGPTAGTRRGCPSRTAVRRGPRSRGDLPSIGLTQVRASCRPLGCRPHRRRTHAGRGCKVASGKVRNLWTVPIRRPALQPRAGTNTWHRAQQSRWLPAPGARLPVRYTSTAISINCQEPEFRFYRLLNRGHPLTY